MPDLGEEMLFFVVFFDLGEEMLFFVVFFVQTHLPVMGKVA